MQNATEGFRLSPQQKRLWLLHRDGAAYRAQSAILIEGDLRAAALKESVRKVIAQHEILRSVYLRLPGMSVPLQIVEDNPSLFWEELDLSDRWADEQSAIEDIFRRQGGRPSNFEQGPIVHARLLKLSAVRRVLLVTLPALCADARTLGTLFQEITRQYAAASRNESPADEVVQYAQFSEWQNSLIEGAGAEEGREFWRERHPDASPPLLLPFENAPGGVAASGPGAFEMAVSPRVCAKLDEVAETHGVAVAEVLLACWQTLLWRLTARPDITVYMISDGRAHEELQDAMGLFAKALPVRCRFEDNTSFADVLAATRQQVSEAEEWQEYFVWRGGTRTDEDGPGPPIGFEFEVWPDRQEAAGATWTVLKQSCRYERFKIKLTCVRNEGGLLTALSYDPALYPASEVAQWAERFHKVLEGAVGNPAGPVAELEIVTDAERRRLVVEFNQTETDYPKDACFHQLFEEQAARTPEAPAIVCEGRRLSYAELNGLANQLANYLRRAGVGPETRVALCVERSPEMLIGLLGIIKAGGAYVPLDISYPKERLALILEDAGAKALLTQERLLEILPPTDSHTALILLDSEWARIGAESPKNLPRKVGAENLAYVIYTSGSTGKPKGVMIPHQGLVNYLCWAAGAYDMAHGNGSLAHSPVGFDLTITSLFCPLLKGQRVTLLGEGDELEKLSDALRREEDFSVLKVTPAHLTALGQLVPPEELRARVRSMVIGGEALMAEMLDYWRTHLPDTRLINEYGPTETVVGCCVYEVRRNESLVGAVAIGRPVANTQLYILDERMRVAPIGGTGELYVGGDGMARGYLNRPDVTAEKFVPDAYGGRPGARLYRTGDLAYYQPDGNIQFVGRNDFQVKIRGNRIELGEIEAVLSQSQAVRECVVTVEETSPGEKRLVAYIVPDQRRAPVVRQLLRLEKEGLLTNRSRYELPNGMEIVSLNAEETEQVYEEIFEERSYLQHGVTLEEGACVFDVGANIGMFTLFAGQVCKNADIYAFEPAPAVYELMKLNASLYRLNVKAFNCGLSDRVKYDSFTFYPHCSVVSGCFADSEEEQEVVKSYLLNRRAAGLGEELLDELLAERLTSESLVCQFQTVSKVIRENDVKRIDLLKIDVEKSELAVLEGIEEEHWPIIRQLVVEVHDTDGLLERVTSLLEGHGFHLTAHQDAVYKNTGLYNIYAVRASASAALGPAPGAASQPGPAWPPAVWNSAGRLIADVQDFLKARLPSYMIPSAFVLLDALPLTPNGKVDRHGLRVTATVTSERKTMFAGPRTPVEEVLAAIWGQVLKLERVSIHDNFFDLGGHSLLATQAIYMMREAFRVETALHNLFESPTIAGLAKIIDASVRVGDRLDLRGVDPVGRDRPLPLSYAQQRLWFLQQIAPDSAAYNVGAAVRLSGRLNIGALEGALSEAVRRHETLRTTFQIVEGAPVQVINPPQPVSLPVTDLSDLPEGELELRFEQEARADVQQPFDLLLDSLLRPRLLRLGPDEHVMLLTMHHVVSDHWSRGVLVRELAALYGAFSNDQPSPLPELRIQYADFAVWQRQTLQGEAFDARLAYWKQKLDGAPTLELPTDHPRPAVQSFLGAHQFLLIPKPLTEGLKALSRREGATLFMTILAAFQTMLHRYTGQEDIVVGVPIANRNHPEIEPLIGFFVNTLAMRTDLSGNPTFRELLARARRVALEAYAHQDLPLERVVEELSLDRDLSRMPLFQVVLGIQNDLPPKVEIPGLAINSLRFETGSAKFDLEMNLAETEQGMTGWLEYALDLFESHSISRMVGHFQRLLHSIVADPDARLSDLELLSESEKTLLDKTTEVEEISGSFSFHNI